MLAVVIQQRVGAVGAAGYVLDLGNALIGGVFILHRVKDVRVADRRLVSVPLENVGTHHVEAAHQRAVFGTLFALDLGQHRRHVGGGQCGKDEAFLVEVDVVVGDRHEGLDAFDLFLRVDEFLHEFGKRVDRNLARRQKSVKFVVLVEGNDTFVDVGRHHIGAAGEIHHDLRRDVAIHEVLIDDRAVLRARGGDGRDQLQRIVVLDRQMIHVFGFGIRHKDVALTGDEDAVRRSETGERAAIAEAFPFVFQIELTIQPQHHVVRLSIAVDAEIDVALRVGIQILDLFHIAEAPIGAADLAHQDVRIRAADRFAPAVIGKGRKRRCGHRRRIHPFGCRTRGGTLRHVGGVAIRGVGLVRRSVGRADGQDRRPIRLRFGHIRRRRRRQRGREQHQQRTQRRQDAQ